MGAASDILYGRQGGRLVDPAPAPASAWPSHQHPTTATVVEHLATEHLTTGITRLSMAGVDPIELLRWHDVDHRLVRVQLLGHTHSATPTPAPTVGDDDRIHQATLKSIAEGKTVPGVDDMCRRAAAVNARLAQADADTAAGRPLAPGARTCSPYDRRCIEVATAVADRAARQTRRRGTAA